MKKTLLILFLSLSAVCGIAQETSSKVPVRAAQSAAKPVFGDKPGAISAYLTEQQVLPQESVPFKRAVFELEIAPDGKVNRASLFFGGITVDSEEKIVRSLLQMPAWKTTTEHSCIVHLVVTIRQQTITTEIY
jgi:hypothetical protein